MEMEFSRLEKLVGTFIIGVSLLLMATLVIIGRGKDWFEKYVTYYTTFNESYNLQENAAVKLFKADIGKVKKITLEKNRVRVELAILEKYASRIREDAVTLVESPTLIGSEYISIIPGSADAPLIPKEGEIQSRDKRSIDDILAEFEVEKTAKMFIKAIQDIAEVSDKLKQADGPLWSALEHIHQTSVNVARITADLQAGQGPMGALLKSEALLQRILSYTEHIDQFLGSLDQAAAEAPRAAAQAKVILDDIQSATAKLQVILDNVKAGSYNVPRISTTFRDGVQEIREGVHELDRVVESLQQNVFIRSNLPSEPAPHSTDAQARPD